MSVNKNVFLADLFQDGMFNSSPGNSLSLECAHLYMGCFLTLGMDLGLLPCSAQPACEGLHRRYTVLAASFLTPANLTGTCGCDSLQTAVKSELPAGSCNNCCQEHPSRGKRYVFCLFVSLFLWGGASSESLFLISSFPPLIFPQQLKQANRNK